MPPPVKVRRKKKVGRPAFKRKDIPQIFFTYYNAYKYGFWNKQDLAYFVGVSRPTLDRYFKAIKAKPPVVTKAENKKLQLQYNVGDSLEEKLDFYYKLKEMHEGQVKRSTGDYGVATRIRFQLRMENLVLERNRTENSTNIQIEYNPTTKDSD